MLEAKSFIKLSWNDILKEVTQEQIMEYYLGVTPGSKLIVSPFRIDKNPGCSFYKSEGGTLFLRDWAKDIKYNWVDCIKAKYNLTFDQALLRAQTDLDKIKSVGEVKELNYEKEYKLIQSEIKPWNEETLSYWCKYGITVSTLKKYNVYCASTIYINKVPAAFYTKSNPIFSYYFPRTNKSKIYRPLAKDRKQKWTCSTTKEEVYGWDYYEDKKGRIIFITSSCKDAMVLHELGFPAIAPSSEANLILEDKITSLKERFDNIIVMMDSDATGIKYNNRYKSVYDLKPALIPIKYCTKDISDTILRYGRRKTFRIVKKIIREAVRIRQNSIPF